MISSEANRQIKEIVKLQKSAKERRKRGLFVAEGRKLVQEAAAYGVLEKIYVSGQVCRQEEVMQMLPESCACEWVSDAVFRTISDTITPQGVLGLVRMPLYSTKDILADKKKSILLLEDLRDPGNLGTILRTAEAAGMSGVILSKNSVDLFNPKTVRSTMGSIFRVPFCYVEQITEIIEEIKERNFPVYGAMMEGSIPYDKADYRKGAGILIGNEANGILPQTAAHLSGSVRIPMEGKLESLNAAVSAALFMYEIARQRKIQKHLE